MTVDLFYDAGCGPCTLWARASAGIAREGVRILALDSREADRALGSMPDTVRFSYFHLARGGRTLTGTDALPLLVGLVAGRTAERVVRRVGFVRRGLDRTYRAFWEYRRTRGCAAGAVAPGS